MALSTVTATGHYVRDDLRPAQGFVQFIPVSTGYSGDTIIAVTPVKAYIDPHTGRLTATLVMDDEALEGEFYVDVVEYVDHVLNRFRIRPTEDFDLATVSRVTPGTTTSLYPATTLYPSTTLYPKA